MTLDFKTLQSQVGSWSRRNFPDNKPHFPFLGVVEEVGEMSHSLLKRQQGIRGTEAEHIAKEKDAIGDIIIYLCDYCERNGYELQPIIEETWARVGARDWTTNKANGGDVAP